MRYLTDFPDLPIMAFRKRPDGHLATLEGGKGGSAPPPPDYEASARETARGNLEATRAAVRANRANQITPWGRLTWRQNPTGGRINYDAYNKAVQNFNQPLTQGRGAPPERPYEGGDYINPIEQQRYERELAAYNAPRERTGTAPRPEDFMEYDPDSGWEQTTELTPEAQAALNEQLALNRKYGEVANLGLSLIHI